MIGPNPGPQVIVGMMCCFGSIARAPLAMILMVSGMTGSYSSIEPGIIAVGIAWLIVHTADDTMYRSQLPHRTISTRAAGDAYI
jgi:CIC family chloride channel protein